MAKKLKEVDVVLFGLGWAGGILAKELSAAGLRVVALERGAMRSTESDYQVPNIRDEFRYSPAMRRSGIVWDVRTLDAYLADPQKAIPANRMPYASMPAASGRADVIDYLSHASR